MNSQFTVEVEPSATSAKLSGFAVRVHMVTEGAGCGKTYLTPPTFDTFMDFSVMSI